MTDAIIDAIERFRAGLAMFNVIPSAVTEKMEDQIIEATYGPPQEVLVAWREPAKTYEGAVAALRLAVDENAQFSGSVIADNMVRAAFAYFATRDEGRSAE